MDLCSYGMNFLVFVGRNRRIPFRSTMVIRRPERMARTYLSRVSVTDFCAEEIDFDFGGRNSGQFRSFMDEVLMKSCANIRSIRV